MTMKRLVLFALALAAGCSGAGSHAGGLAPALLAPQRAAGGSGSAAEARDLGRRAVGKPVSVVVQLRYNHASELERLVEGMADPHSATFHRYLSSAAFDARFAPTPAQEREALDALRAAGFTVDRRYANRALIDAHAPSAVVERYFGTEIHDFAQGPFGTRFANVRPVRLPAPFARDVASVTIDTVVHRRTFATALPSLALPPAPDPTGTWGAIGNGGFETGKLAPWTPCSAKKSAPRATVSRLHPYAGHFDALTGTQTSGEPDGLDGICQKVAVPSRNPLLTAFLYQLTDQQEGKGGSQLVALYSTAGTPLDTLLETNRNKAAWVQQQWSLRKYAGKTVVLFFGVLGGGESQWSIQQFVDDVTLVSGAPAPSPSPSPLVTPTPGGTVRPGPGAPIAGPTYGPLGGYGPLALADGFDFPVQHGYDGAGKTAAIVIDCEVPAGVLSAYLSHYAIHQTGTVSYEIIDGGPAPAPVCKNDGLEADLDVETIAGLAPGANVVVYTVGSLDDQSIEDAYNQVVSDDTAVAVNSSFGGCDAQDPAFDSQSDATAVNGAALGITFSASSGDQGSACYTSSGFVYGTNAPASDPHFVGVGGNESDDDITAAQAWNDCASTGSSACATGGGVSTVWPLPSYQRGLAGHPSSGSHRNVPDIAFPAVNDDIYANGSFGVIPAGIVGTSWGSPVNVALLTETAQICQGAGFANQTIYALYAAKGESPLFVDVTGGSNAYDNPTTKAYHAGTGYDNTTGIGMPKGFDFSAAMCGKAP